MVNKTEIQVFVSCPGDVRVEKQIVENVCQILNNSSDNYCKIIFKVKEWEAIVGQFGNRPQGIINEVIGSYDIYVGIWWMRFGSKTGAINPSTGEDYLSGTEEEFYIAYENWKQFKIPNIYLFFKHPKATSIATEIGQLGKVIEFRDNQKNNGWVNFFNEAVEFQGKVFQLLNEKLLANCLSQKIELKKDIMQTSEINIEEFRVNYESIKGYMTRTLTHYKEIKYRRLALFTEPEAKSLDVLLRTKKKIILLGDAGSGKSTELKNLAYTLNNNESGFFPIYRGLNLYTPEIGIENFLPESWKKIPSESLILILDGLDEIQPEDFNKVVRQLSDFSEKHSDLRMVISCRTNFYELPANSIPGTLNDFEPYFVGDLRPKDVIEYYSLRYKQEDAQLFINATYDQHLDDLTRRPYFLMLLADQYSQNRNLTDRAGLNEFFLSSRLSLDKIHFKGTHKLPSEQKIFLLLERVALCMESMGRNWIQESELLEIIKEEDFETLRYGTVFKKAEGKENVWQFEHNNNQEYLAAKALSKLDFDNVIKFITFAPDYKKVIPTWVNTMAFLFNILSKESDLFRKLLNQLLENQQELVVRFEKDKVPEQIRNEIFIRIFEHYKSHNVWINSNKFKDSELAKFGESDVTVKYLIQELMNKKNPVTIEINAVILIRHFSHFDHQTRVELQSLLLSIVRENQNESQLINHVIYALQNIAIDKKEALLSLMEVLSQRRNQFIRASLYSYILNANAADDYTEYLSEGRKIIETRGEDRDSVSLFDEGYSLNNCIKSVKRPDSIKKIITYLKENNQFEHIHDFEEILDEIINNVIEAYYKDNTIYNLIFEWFLKDIFDYIGYKMNAILLFFNKTNTKEQAFMDLWFQDIEYRIKIIGLARLANNKTLDFVIEKYLNRDIDNNFLQQLYYDLYSTNNSYLEYLESLIVGKTLYKLQKVIDNKILKMQTEKKRKKNFDLYFNKQKFEEETLRIFDSEGKEEFLLDELYDITRYNNREIELDERYAEPSLHLLRSFNPIRQNPIYKKDVVEWFKKIDSVVWYCIISIHNKLLNDKEIELSSDQKVWVIKWCLENIKKVDFKKAITVDGTHLNINNLASFIFYFSYLFDINYSKEIMLDMLSFDQMKSNNNWIGIDFLIKKLPTDEVKERMLENLRNGITFDEVLKNHFYYLSKEKINESYPLLLRELINPIRSLHSRIEMFDMYFENTNDISGAKRIISEADIGLKWHIADKLIGINETVFLNDYLLRLLKSTSNEPDLIKVCEYLIKLNSMEGLRTFLNLLKGKDSLPQGGFSFGSLSMLRDKEAIPLLIELLDMDYSKKIKTEMFDNMSHEILAALFNIAYVGDDNFEIVRASLDEFRKKNLEVYKNINYLQLSIERMEEQFYMNKARSSTISEVKQKLKSIQA